MAFLVGVVLSFISGFVMGRLWAAIMSRTIVVRKDKKCDEEPDLIDSLRQGRVKEWRRHREAFKILERDARNQYIHEN